ncbi:hypothetical protein Tco_0276491, partial [Tanacetum coccineum]
FPSNLSLTSQPTSHSCSWFDHKITRILQNWSDHEESADENASQVYGMIAGRDDDDEVAGEFALMGVTSQVQTYPFGCHDKYAELKKEFDDLEVQYKEYYIQVQAYKITLKTLEQQKAWYQSNQLAYEEKVKVLKRDLENTTNLLKYSESINNNVNLEKQELQTKLDNTLARFAKWKESSKNLARGSISLRGGLLLYSLYSNYFAVVPIDAGWTLILLWLVQEGTALGKDYIKSVNGCDDLPKIIRLASPGVNGYLVKASSIPFLFFDSPLPGVNTPWDMMRIECGASESLMVSMSQVFIVSIYAHMLVKCFVAIPSQVSILKAKIYLET